MEGFFRCSNARVAILFFSVASVTTLAATPKHMVSFVNERIDPEEDGIFWSENKQGASTAPIISGSSSSSSKWSKLHYSLFANDDEYDIKLEQKRLCDIGDGYVYREDEVLATFVTRCGSVEHFPCYCAPDLDPPIRCPYCGFHSSMANREANAERKKISNSENFFCLKDGETSDPFACKSGKINECSCNVEGNIAMKTCSEPGSVTERPPVANAGNSNDPAVSEATQDEAITNDTESTVSTTNGNDSGVQQTEAEGIIKNEDESPTSKVVPIDSASNDNEPIVGEETENYSVANQSESLASKLLPTENPPNDIEPVVNKETEDESVEVDSEVPPTNLAPDIAPMDSSTNDNVPVINTEAEEETEEYNDDYNPMFSQSLVPVTSAEMVINDNVSPSLRRAPIDDDDICTLILEGTGETKTFRRGESYGNYLPARCSQPSKFPCFCNPDLITQVECPYCSYMTDNGDLLCANNKETISFTAKTGDVETCTCFVHPGKKPLEVCSVSYHSEDPLEKNSDTYNDEYRGIGKASSGNDIDVHGNGEIHIASDVVKGCDVTDPSTRDHTVVPFGESFSDYIEVEGLCGDGVEWPAYCRGGMATPDTTVVHFPQEQRPYSDNFQSRSTLYIGDRDDVAYPYCIFGDTLSGEPVCAKDTAQVVYTAEDGKRVRCSCRYTSEGAQSTCSPYLSLSDDNDTQAPPHSNTNPQVATPTYGPIISPTNAPVGTYRPSMRASTPYNYASGSASRTDKVCSIVVGILKTTMLSIMGHTFAAIL